MSYRIPRYIRLFDLLLIIIIVILISGCQLLVRRISQTSPIPSLNGKIVVLGFRSAVSKVEEAGKNILEARIFFKGKGKWMTVESLADLGLSDILDGAFSLE